MQTVSLFFRHVTRRAHKSPMPLQTLMPFFLDIRPQSQRPPFFANLTAGRSRPFFQQWFGTGPISSPHCSPVTDASVLHPVLKKAPTCSDERRHPPALLCKKRSQSTRSSLSCSTRVEDTSWMRGHGAPEELEASPCRTRKASRTWEALSKDLSMKGQPYPRFGGCVWYHVTCRARPLPRCCSPDKKWRGDRGMIHGLSVVVAVRLHVDQSGQLFFQRPFVYTREKKISRWLISSMHMVCARGRSGGIIL